MKAKILFPYVSFKRLLDKIIGIENKVNEQNEKIPFSLAIDENGNYGYIKEGADTVTPFNQMVKGTSTMAGYSTFTKVTLGFKPRVVFAYCTTGNGYISSWFYAEDLLNVNLRRSTSNFTATGMIEVYDDGFSWDSMDSSWGSMTITYVAAI